MIFQTLNCKFCDKLYSHRCLQKDCEIKNDLTLYAELVALLKIKADHAIL